MNTHLCKGWNVRVDEDRVDTDFGDAVLRVGRPWAVWTFVVLRQQDVDVQRVRHRQEAPCRIIITAWILDTRLVPLVRRERPKGTAAINGGVFGNAARRSAGCSWAGCCGVGKRHRPYGQMRCLEDQTLPIFSRWPHEILILRLHAAVPERLTSDG